jgi:aspartate racemase
MSENVIGILGGMGPEATVDCFAKIVGNTPAQKDQDHLRVVIDNNPKVPERTPAILGRGESPIAVMVQGCRVLEKAGADFIIIPCVSAHFFIEEIQEQINLPILSMFDAVAERIEQGHPRIGTVGLLATTGTISGGRFQQRLSASGIRTVVPNDELQRRVMTCIHEIKSAGSKRTRAAVSSDLADVANSLLKLENRDVGAIIAGCTEIPLALSQKHLPVPYFDSLLILARAAIRRAGLEPIPLA